tara:strand:- start:37 stop:420 length:384 start_codon:yes stop_codon:yes gene_type:complete
MISRSSSSISACGTSPAAEEEEGDDDDEDDEKDDGDDDDEAIGRADETNKAAAASARAKESEVSFFCSFQCDAIVNPRMISVENEKTCVRKKEQNGIFLFLHFKPVPFVSLRCFLLFYFYFILFLFI